MDQSGWLELYPTLVETDCGDCHECVAVVPLSGPTELEAEQFGSVLVLQRPSCNQAGG